MTAAINMNNLVGCYYIASVKVLMLPFQMNRLPEVNSIDASFFNSTGNLVFQGQHVMAVLSASFGHIQKEERIQVSLMAFRNNLEISTTSILSKWTERK